MDREEDGQSLRSVPQRNPYNRQTFSLSKGFYRLIGWIVAVIVVALIAIAFLAWKKGYFESNLPEWEIPFSEMKEGYVGFIEAKDVYLVGWAYCHWLTSENTIVRRWYSDDCEVIKVTMRPGEGENGISWCMASGYHLQKHH